MRVRKSFAVPESRRCLVAGEVTNRPRGHPECGTRLIKRVRHEGINRFLIGVRLAVSRAEVSEPDALPIVWLMGGTVSANHKRTLWAVLPPVCRQIRPEPPAQKD